LHDKKFKTDVGGLVLGRDLAERTAVQIFECAVPKMTIWCRISQDPLLKSEGGIVKSGAGWALEYATIKLAPPHP
jgi:hypothetical protein